jgi:hypothetical protein
LVIKDAAAKVKAKKAELFSPFRAEAVLLRPLWLHYNLNWRRPTKKHGQER